MINKSNIVKYLIACFLSFFCLFADAKVVASVSGPSGDAIILKDDICMEHFHEFQIQNDKAEVVKKGCWFVYGETVVMLLEEGEVGLAPISYFRPGLFR